MAVTLENGLNLLKKVFTDRLVSQTNDRDNLYGMMPQSGKRFDGEQIVGALVTGYPASGGARGPTAAVPVPSQTTVLQHRFSPTFHWHSIEIYHDIQKKSAAGGPASWMGAIALEVNRAGMFFQKSLSRQTAGDGSGVLGQISSISGNVITLTDKYDSVNFERGQRIDVIDVNNDSSTSQLTFSAEADFPVVSSVSVGASSATVTLNKAPTNAAANDYIITYAAQKLGSGADDSLTNEFYGLDAIISNSAPEYLPNNGGTSEPQGTFQGLDPNVHGEWRSQVVDAGGASGDYLSPGHLRDAILQAQVFGAGEPQQLNCLFCHHLQFEKFSDTDTLGRQYSEDSGTSIRRYPSQDGSFRVGGFRQGQQSEKSDIVYDQTRIKRSRYLKRDRAYYVNNMSAQRFVLQEVGFWTDMEGKTFHKSFDNNTSYRAELVYIGALATEIRNSAIRITNLKTTGF